MTGTICQVAREQSDGTCARVEFDVVDLGGNLMIARDVGQPNAEILGAGGDNSNRELPRAQSDFSGGDRLVVIGRLTGSSAHADAKTLAEDIVKPFIPDSDDQGNDLARGTPFEVGIEFANNGYLFGAEVGPTSEGALELSYPAGETDMVRVRLVVDIVSCLNLGGGGVDLANLPSDSWAWGGAIGGTATGVNPMYQQRSWFPLVHDPSNSRLYAFGGSDTTDGDPITDVEYYDLSAEEWNTSPTNLPTAVYGHVGEYIDGTIYLAGGFDSDWRATLLAYDIANDSYTTKTAMSTARYTPTCATDGTDLYVIGGSDSGGNLSSVEIYDVSADSWSSGTDMPTARDALPANITPIDGAVYVVAGGTNTNTNEAYDISADSWDSTVANLPSTTDNAAVGVESGLLYEFNTGNVYDPNADSWSSIRYPDLAYREDPGQRMPLAHLNGGAQTVSGLIYRAGGSAGNIQTLTDAYKP